ncbi:hypothetical protein [Rhodanobacter sp. K2T2]|uniref:hypothetical protein n=1 Tax=Rhodanobacter sp. K2T2 TaxID=2723085 RepID=UPI001C53FB92|nr:hypothetical protein [Rhodanobacter sp. K2T2]
MSHKAIDEVKAWPTARKSAWSGLIKPIRPLTKPQCDFIRCDCPTTFGVMPLSRARTMAEMTLSIPASFSFTAAGRNSLDGFLDTFVAIKSSFSRLWARNPAEDYPR